jgi:glyoxylase-like metal-dependent hydrolase (beta-lactamase superfamily II)
MCPHGRRLINGDGGLLEDGEIVCNCLLIEADDGLVLVDTGFGREDVRTPRQLGFAFRLIRPRADLSEVAAERVGALGFDPGDVRRIVVTHLDPDHSGGLPDFPDAEVHVFGRELEVALDPPLRERVRYIGNHWKHGPNWIRHEVDGDEWFGFESVRVLPGSGAEIALVPLLGHTLGHTGVAINTGDGWLLHCGDAYFHHGEVASPPHCPPGLRLFQLLNAADTRQRKANQERLRELVARHGAELTLINSHDPLYLDV